jgi:predicted O-methyltransferase YrrM
MGPAKGYSAIWIGFGMKKSEGSPATIKIDPLNAALCLSTGKRAELEKTVACLRGDAVRVASGLDGELEFLFMDAGPMDVRPFIKAAAPKLSQWHIIVLLNAEFARACTQFLERA